MIDYGRIDRSIDYYSGIGFTRIESPWTVTEEVSGITRPPGAKDWKIIGKEKVLVASGEQSFLYLYLKGFLPKGCFQTVTPCFRDEPFDNTHSKYFIKNELICTDTVTERRLEDLVQTCFDFFEKELGYSPDLKIIRTESGYDINWRDIELGSYGIRGCNFIDWIYATGLAEPRASMAKYIITKEQNGISH